jgi:hypothetical protein
VEEVEILVSFLILEDIHSDFSPFSIILAIGLSYVAYLIYDTFIPNFLRDFIHVNFFIMLNFVKGFFCIY